MYQILKAPCRQKVDNKTIFLAGTIDNGNSVDWQSHVQDTLKKYDVTIFNPRSESWNADWEQSIKNPEFKEQVEWELEHLEKSDCILMHFAPGSKSPITLLELGLLAKSGKIFISCPEGFWRRGNIEVVAARYSIPIFENLDDALGQAINKLGLKDII